MKKPVTAQTEAAIRAELLRVLGAGYQTAAANPPGGVALPFSDAAHFTRVILDCATRSDWRLTAASPVYRTLPLLSVARAVGVARQCLSEGAATCADYIRKSDALREQYAGKVGAIK